MIPSATLKSSKFPRAMSTPSRETAPVMWLTGTWKNPRRSPFT